MKAEVLIELLETAETLIAEALEKGELRILGKPL